MPNSYTNYDLLEINDKGSTTCHTKIICRLLGATTVEIYKFLLLEGEISIPKISAPKSYIR